MPADNRMVFTQGAPLSSFSDFRGNVASRFTTPSVYAPGGINADRMMAVRAFVASFTNVNVGAFTIPRLTLGLQGALGNPATEANWVDLMAFPQLRPYVPGNLAAGGSNGAGTPGNLVLSNVVIRRVAGPLPYTNYRLTGQFIGSSPYFGGFYAVLEAAHRQPTDPA